MNRSRLFSWGVLSALLLLGSPAAGATDADADRPLWPGALYDPAIPTLEQVLGHRPGEWISSPEEIVRYFEALAEAAPERIRVWEYARTWEDRPLIYAAVGSSETLSRLDEIRDGMQRLADPRRTDAAAAERLIAELPALVWLAYGVHGNEISSPDAALFTAYHLLAAEGDPTVENILRDALVLIDPLQNPDGRNRFVHSFESSYGIRPDPDRLAAEHDEPWPGGRTNHYLFDMNRDWFALTQPETRGRVAVLQQWYPLVFVDLHEMGGDSTYYFAPEAVPYNPHLAQAQRDNLELFGRNNAEWFDRYGFDYFTREIYDAFYPGYGASWPAYYGAVAMTYEQASPRGLELLRSDGGLLTFREAVRHHFVASISTAETAARHREKLLRDFYAYRVSAIDEGRRGDVREIVLPYRGDVAAVSKLAGLLAAQGVEMKRAEGPITSCGLKAPAGSWVIPLAQPAKRFIRNLLDPEVPMESEFLAEQERRRAKRLGDQIYDVTAWSLPLMFGVEALPCATRATGELVDAEPVLVPPGRVVGSDARVAYLVPWGNTASGRLLARALDQGLVALSPDVAFTQDGREYPAGSLVFKVDDNPEDLEERLRALAEETGAEVLATDHSWVEEGVNWGSRRAVRLRAPRIALAWDDPVSSYSAGATRFVLERQFGYPVTVIRTARLARADLTRYQVLILPAARGGYARTLGDAGGENLVRWVRAGGTLVAFESAIDFLASEAVGLLATERQPLETESGADAVVLDSESAYREAIQPASPAPDNVAGVLLRARVDPDHWLGAGLPPTVNVLYDGSAIYRPLALDKGTNALLFTDADSVLVSGYLWEENRRHLAYKPFVMTARHGRGQVIAFTADPTTRAYLDGLDLLLLNAVFRAPAHAMPTVWP